MMLEVGGLAKTLAGNDANRTTPSPCNRLVPPFCLQAFVSAAPEKQVGPDSYAGVPCRGSNKKHFVPISVLERSCSNWLITPLVSNGQLPSSAFIVKLYYNV